MTLIDAQAIPSFASLGRVHFIAIGGAGMSGVASAFLARGLTVSGSDQVDSETLQALTRQGAQIWIGHDAAHLTGVDTVVISSAIRETNVELAEARRLGLPVLHRSVALACLMEDRRVISVAGTHGKTTTTAMAVSAFLGAGADPSYVLGGTFLESGLGAHLGTTDQFIVEADESDGSFRQYPTTIAVVTTLEADHLDNWGTPELYAQGFEQFASSPTVSLVIVDGDDPGARFLGQSLAAAGRQVITYGEGDDCDLRLSQVNMTGLSSLARLSWGEWSATLRLQVPGNHNLHNAAAAFAVGAALGLDRAGLLEGLAQFRGTARRFQRLGCTRGVLVVDDYAHHPTEVAATIKAARIVADAGRVIACFQPHLYTRTRDFATEFAQALAAADEVVVLDVYPAREDPIAGVSGELIVDALKSFTGSVHYVPRLEDAPAALEPLAGPGDLVLTLGAGSVTAVGPLLLRLLEE
ncbi:MAG: UDP-N-acetylmuramate--L-alanine ligase [Propionibacteriaceae bacterium]|jgi:UDP-N-acetylmuramate--alanine ligase|nr:UDP-N-acetylmuramate--L-alanine ligase [Propionibacteriaceae bacterium]